VNYNECMGIETPCWSPDSLGPNSAGTNSDSRKSQVKVLSDDDDIFSQPRLSIPPLLSLLINTSPYLPPTHQQSTSHHQTPCTGPHKAHSSTHYPQPLRNASHVHPLPQRNPAIHTQKSQRRRNYKISTSSTLLAGRQVLEAQGYVEEEIWLVVDAAE